MKLHPRHDLTTAADIDIKTAVTEAIARHPDLSHAELQHIFLGIALSWNKFAIRDEREAEKPDPLPERMDHCHAGRDGECNWKACPQIRDNEPTATGRHCPLDVWRDEE